MNKLNKGGSVVSLIHPEMSDFKCPVCGTSEDRPVFVIPVSEDIEQVHKDCYKKNAILRMEEQIEHYIKLNRKHEIRLRGKAFSMVDTHLDDVQILLDDSLGDEDELRNILDLIKAV